VQYGVGRRPLRREDGGGRVAEVIRLETKFGKVVILGAPHLSDFNRD